MMKFSIGTVSSNIDYSEDYKLIKSSILYADEIELIGMTEYALFSYLPKKINSANDIETLINNFVPFLRSVEADGSDELADQIEELSIKMKQYDHILKKKKRRSKQEILAQLEMKKALKTCKDEITSSIQGLMNSHYAAQIAELIEKKIVSVYDYGYDGFDKEELAGGYFGNLMNVMHDHTSYPLFDELSTGIIASFVDAQIIDLGNLNKEVLRHAGVATNILMTLPSLEEASIDELLDLKRELQSPLVGFRKAVYEFSEKINSLPWDKNFEYDCLKLYSTEVAPRIEELNTLATHTSVLRNLGKRVLEDEEIRKKTGWTVGGIATIISTESNVFGVFEQLKGWIISMALLGISGPMASAFLKTASYIQKTKDEVEAVKEQMSGNVMYYYYKLEDSLSKKN